MVVGNTNNSYGRSIVRKYKTDKRIFFSGALFDQDIVHTLRKNASLYFHGHSVGGTNPSLLEAMASKILIAAHDNAFNKAILQQDAFYFSTGEDVKKIIESYTCKKNGDQIANNFRKIEEQYNWDKVIDHYDEFISHCHKKYLTRKISYKGSYGNLELGMRNSE
jgi:glycosyltransferase involved in cell wall biosynthesis